MTFSRSHVSWMVMISCVLLANRLFHTGSLNLPPDILCDNMVKVDMESGGRDTRHTSFFAVEETT